MKTILVTLYHKRSLFYEEGIAHLLDAGFPLIIYETGVDQGFGHFGLVHENVTQYESQTSIPYDQGVVDLKDILAKHEWDTVVFLDSDLFFENAKYAKALIKQFNKTDFGYCSYFENSTIYKPEYKFDGLIAEVKNQKFEPVEYYPGFYPQPHWENAFMLIKRTLWDKLSKDDVSHGRKMVKAIFESGVKMGVHKRDSKLVFSHKGDGWFHVGNLTRYYNLLEDGLFDSLSKDSNVDTARIGYFIAQRSKYGKEIYSDAVNKNLDLAIEKLGGASFLHVCWADLMGYVS